MNSGWTWEATATIIQAVATVAALAGVAVTFLYAARAEKRESAKAHADAQAKRVEAERASASAERAERAAALSIDTLARIAGAVEALATMEFGRASLVRSHEPERARWSLEHHLGDTYILKNVGNATAYDVHVSADASLMTADELPAVQDIPAGGTLTFMAGVTYDTRDTTIAVSWVNSAEVGAVRDTWRYPLPGRPPR